ncbi:MAG TPA: 4Fe-4S binding protein [Candidatus Bathyarchaeia archaeon]|nr:4Fe-4S binding protein [Candidatus Bathyarchaeia archaeon]
MKRQIIKIDESKCTGCGLCIPNCPEGALQLIDGKARVVNESMCDGLGACIGYCPEGAITIEEREAKPYDERQAMHEIVKQGKAVIAAHLKHLHEHRQEEYLKQALAYLKDHHIDSDFSPAVSQGHSHGPHGSCPGSMMLDRRTQAPVVVSETAVEYPSELRQWPVQLTLLNPGASYFQEADIVLAADCVPFAYAGFHQQFLKGKTLIIFCPKLDLDLEQYKEKLTVIFRENHVHSVTVVRMQVPCCSGMTRLTTEAIAASGKDLTFNEVIISLDGKILKS